MRSTKIIVLQLKEIIYTVLFVALGIFLILLLIFMFTNKKESPTTPTMKYIPGVYTSSVILDQQSVNVEVVVDDDHINSVRLTNLDTAVESLYPLLQPTMNNLETQLVNDTAIENLDIDLASKTTSDVLLGAIQNALAKAEVQEKDSEIEE